MQDYADAYMSFNYETANVSEYRYFNDVCNVWNEELKLSNITNL